MAKKQRSYTIPVRLATKAVRICTGITRTTSVTKRSARFKGLLKLARALVSKGNLLCGKVLRLVAKNLELDRLIVHAVLPQDLDSPYEGVPVPNRPTHLNRPTPRRHDMTLIRGGCIAPGGLVFVEQIPSEQDAVHLAPDSLLEYFLEGFEGVLLSDRIRLHIPKMVIGGDKHLEEIPLRWSRPHGGVDERATLSLISNPNRSATVGARNTQENKNSKP
eukprot:1192099-Prorocentrum_minimum.AAC.5